MIKSFDGKLVLSAMQAERINATVSDIIERLPPAALNELLGGYSYDIDAMIIEMQRSTELSLNLGKSLDSELLNYVECVKATMDEQLRVMSWNYFNATVLTNFLMGWRNLEWGNLTQLFPWSSYLCSRGSGKTTCAGTEVVMYDGSLKKVEDIVVGDRVMGPDSTPRTVLETHICEGESYQIQQKHGLNYTVNAEHILHLQEDKFGYTSYGHGHKRQNGQNILEVSAKDYLEKIPDSRKKRLYGYRVNGWDLPEQDLPIDPYIFGTWLGDGHSNYTKITSADQEIINSWSSYAKELGLAFFKLKGKYLYSIANNRGTRQTNNFLEKLRELNVIKNKHIPEIYMRGSRQQRLQLLAGIVDTDGHLNKRKTQFEVTLKEGSFASQVRDLAWSLGFRVTFRKRVVKGFGREEVVIGIDIHTIPTKVKRKQAPKIEVSQDLRRGKISVTKGDVMKFYGFYLDGDHLYLHKDGTVVHNSYQWAYSFILWRLYSYYRPSFYRKNTIDNQNRKETALITNTMTLAKVHVGKIIEEIQMNPIISEKLNPNGKAKIGETGLETETGSMLHVRGKDGFIRGLHVGAALVDDLPDESSLYSDEQREKLKEVFRGTITPIVEPYGYLLVTGTPYATAPNELYNLIKADKRFAVFEYPVIFPDGRPLAPDRYTFEDLLEKKQELGTMVFSREYLVVPIADSSTIFPYEYLMRATIGMENISFSESIDTFPFKMKKVVLGCDFAISGNIGADFTVFTVWGIDAMNNFYLLAVHREQGMSHNEQIDKIVLWDRLFKPNTIVCEANGFQGILSALARERGLKNIESFTTTDGNKKDLHSGWPSLSAMFERGQIRVPYKDGDTRKMIEIVFGEFSSITFRSDRGKLEAVGAHDDIVSSSFMAINKLREDNKVTFKVDYV